MPSPTLALLEAIIDREADLHDLSGLHTPHEIIEQSTGWWGAGMPKSLIAIGNDSLGNTFCFDIADLHGDTVASAPAYFWDHDFGTVELVGASFPDWIGNFVGKWSEGLTYKDF